MDDSAQLVLNAIIHHANEIGQETQEYSEQVQEILPNELAEQVQQTVKIVKQNKNDSIVEVRLIIYYLNTLNSILLCQLFINFFFELIAIF